MNSAYQSFQPLQEDPIFQWLQQFLAMLVWFDFKNWIIEIPLSNDTESLCLQR